MDLGYNWRLQLSPTGPNKITPPEGATPISLGANIAGEERRGFAGRIPTITIGGYELKDAVAEFVSEEHADQCFSEGMIGLGLLSRFNLVFDYTRQRLFMEPNRSFGDSFD